MRLDMEALAIVKSIASEAQEECTHPDGSYSPRQVARRFVDILASMEGSGRPWVADLLEELTVAGAVEKLRDNARKTEPGYTRRGVKLPHTIGWTDARGNAVRRPLASLRVNDLRRLCDEEAARARGASTRCREYRRLLAAMEQDPSLKTVGHALTAQERAA